MTDYVVPPEIRDRAIDLLKERKKVKALAFLKEETELEGKPLVAYFNGLRYEVLSRGVPPEVESAALELISKGKSRKAVKEVAKSTELGYEKSADYVKVLEVLDGRRIA
ncbi:hypothetical protein GCM10010191_21240 [Actinomadura vinacea]|uniref:Uncharacterized protein n=1 Tax=Actinomadura vinacea TaxID=115336 RepID=A0ABN3IQV5_9ACTN